MKTFALLLLLAQLSPALNSDELALVSPSERARLEACAPIQRAVINYRDTLRVRCADGVVWRIDVPSGAVSPDKKPLKAKLKNIGLAVVGVAIVIIYIAAQGHIPGGMTP